MPARPRRRPVGKFIALPRRGQTERAASAVSLIRRVQRYSRYARGGGGRGGRVSGSTPFPPTVTSPAGWKCYNEWNDIKEKSELFFFIFIFFIHAKPVRNFCPGNERTTRRSTIRVARPMILTFVRGRGLDGENVVHEQWWQFFFFNFSPAK